MIKEDVIDKSCIMHERQSNEYKILERESEMAAP
jgi:hypothetical protein